MLARLNASPERAKSTNEGNSLRPASDTDAYQPRKGVIS